MFLEIIRSEIKSYALKRCLSTKSMSVCYASGATDGKSHSLIISPNT
jgi:hypothetical protein